MSLLQHGKLLSKYPAAVLLAVVVIGGCLGISQPSAWADTADESQSRLASLKPYMPFDEPKPKIPEKILSDSRLDQRVKVFVKSKNFRQLFAELSEKTGVKLTSSRKLWGERAIIYFHDRPLRDVMTEISGLFGYHWLVKGEQGAYRYELFEDTRHARRRKQLREERKEVQNALLLELLKQTGEDRLDDAGLTRLEQSDPRAYRSFTSPFNKDEARLLWQFGQRFIRKVLDSGEISYFFEELSPRNQTAICDWGNRFFERLQEASREHGLAPFDFTPCTPADVAGAPVTFRGHRSLFGFPRLYLEIKTPEGGTAPVETSEGSTRLPRIGWWPSGVHRERQVWRLMGGSVPEGVIGDEELPDKPAITADKLRRLGYVHALLTGDALQAVAEQSAKDIVADYYFQEHHFLNPTPIQKEPLRTVISGLCRTLDYTCQVDGPTLRLRFNQWYVRPLSEEPPAWLTKRLWKTVEETGTVGLEDLVRIASLPDRQSEWPGFGFIVYPAAASEPVARAALRFWRELDDGLKSMAQSEQGLPVAELGPRQRDRLVSWARRLKLDVPLSGLGWFVVRVSYLKIHLDDGGNRYYFILDVPDGSSYTTRVSLMWPLGEKTRKEVAAQHRADMEADVIEVLD